LLADTWALDDSIEHWTKRFAIVAGVGVSFGVGYHLAGLIQPAAYHDLPFPMPIELHQAVCGVNAAVEGVDATKRSASDLKKPSEDT
jgi:hypothetical protein